MKKITLLLSLLFLCTLLPWGGANAQTTTFYKPGERKTTFAAGDKMYIYNATVPDNQNRTGFFKENGASQIKYTLKKPYATEINDIVYGDNVGSDHIWTIESAETLQSGIIKVSIKSPSNKFLAFNGTPNNNIVYLYLDECIGTELTMHGDGFAAEDIDGTKLSKTSITAEHKLWTVRQNETSGNYWNGNIGDFTTWGTPHAYAFYSVAEANTEFAEYIKDEIAEVNTFLTEAGYSQTEANLKDKISTNADENTGGGWTDGEGITALTDNNPTTYFHSRWSGSAIENDEYGSWHHIQINLGDNNSTNAFYFDYTTRDNGEQHPTAMTIYGSTDGTTFEEITQISNLPNPYQEASVTYTSAPIIASKAYQYIRLSVTANGSGTKFHEKPIFAMAEFNLFTIASNDAYSSRKKYLYNLYSLTQAAPKSTNSFEEFQSSYQFIKDGAELKNYPFELTTDDDNPVCYAINSGRGTNRYFTLKVLEGTSEGYVKLDDNANYKENVYCYWYFKEDPANGHLMIFPFAEPENPLGYTTINNGANALNNKGTLVGKYYVVVSSGNNDYPWALRPYSNLSTYVSNHGGVNNYMGFHNGMDGGTYLKFVEMGATPSLKLREVNKYYIPNKKISSKLKAERDQLNTVSSATADPFLTAISNAETLLTTQAATIIDDETVGVYKIDLMLSIDQLSMYMPTSGFYRLFCKNGLKYLALDKEVETKATLDNDVNNVNKIFYYHKEGNTEYILSYTKGYYLKDQKLTATQTTLNFEQETKEYGSYYVKIGNRYQYGMDNELNSGTGSGVYGNTGYEWLLEKVTTLPVTLNKANDGYGYATLYTPVALEANENVIAYTGTIADGTLKMLSVDDIIPANTAVVLKTVNTIDATTTYNFTITDEEGETRDNDLRGQIVTAKATVGANETVCTLQPSENGVGFYKYITSSTDETVPNINGFRCYLPVPTGSNIKGFAFDFGTETSIDQVEAEEGVEKYEIYDLMGRRVVKPGKGIYVVNGKAVLFN